MPYPLQLVKQRPVWRLPSSNPHDIYVELYLNTAGLSYTNTISAYPYSTATGLVQSLPVVIQGHLAHDSKHAIDYIKENLCNLDELRSDSEHASIRCQSIAIDRLIDLLYALSVIERARFQDFDREYAHDVSIGVREYIRLQHQREIQQYIKLHVQSINPSTEIQSEIKAILQSFNQVVEDSSFPFIYAAQPSSLDCKLAGVIAWLMRIPINEPKSKPETTRSTDQSNDQPIDQPIEQSILPFSTFLVKSFPSLVAHSEHMFNTFFSQYANGLVDESVDQTIDQYRQRISTKLRMVGGRQSGGSHNLTLSPSPQAVIAQYNLEADISRLVKERRQKWNEPSATMREFQLNPLPPRRGDDWLDNVPLTDAEKAEQFKRRTKTFGIFALGAAVVLTIYKRNQASSS